MPVILPDSGYDLWLQPEDADPEMLNPLLVPCPADAMQAYPVSTRVNNPRNDAPDLLTPTE